MVRNWSFWMSTTSLTKKKRRLLCKKLLKPTAKNRVSVTGKSTIHAPFTKSIVFGKSIRLRRLCERECEYLEALTYLKEKCLMSCFCKA